MHLLDTRVNKGKGRGCYESCSPNFFGETGPALYTRKLGQHSLDEHDRLKLV